MTRPRVAFLSVFFAIVSLASCGGEPTEQRPPASGPLVPAEPARPKVLVIGDAMTAGHGLLEAQTVPGVLQAWLDQAGYDVEVAHAGDPSETTATALERLAGWLSGDVRIVVLAVGREDGRRGVPPEQVQANLTAIVETLQAHGVAVLLAGFDAPPIHGPDYAARFRLAFQDVARRYRLVFVPDVLQGIGRDLVQPDGVSPTAQGARVIAGRLWQALQPMVDALGNG